MTDKQPFKIQINPTYKQSLGWKKLKDKTTRFILFGGAANGGKSWLGCEWLLIMCIAYPGTKWFLARNELKRIMSSTYITFLKVCKYHNIPRESWKLDSKYNYIEFWNGSRIDLLDVAYQPRDPLYERFGSTEYTSGWLEEVGEIKGKAFDVLKSRIGRQKNSEYGLFPKMLLTCNPKKNWVYFDFYKKWKEGILEDDSCFIQSLYTDNPYADSDYGAMLNKIKDPILRARLKDGNWEYDDDKSSIMNYESILDIFGRTNPNTGSFYLTVDPARFGRDKAVIFLWQGYFIRKIWYYGKSSGPFLESKIINVCEQYHIPFENVVIDQDGLGGYLVDHLHGVIAFVNGGSPVTEFDDDKKYRIQETDKYSYRNLRSQCYFKLAEYINRNVKIENGKVLFDNFGKPVYTQGVIGCYSEIEPDVRNWIIEELEAIRRKDVENNEKKLQIISKEDIKETIGRSCDFSDNMMMRMVFGLGMSKDLVGEGFEIDVAF